MTEPDAGALFLQQLDCRFDQNRAQAITCDQRPASLSARQQGFAHHCAGKAGGPFGRIDVQRRKQQRLHQPLIERSLAADGIPDQFAWRRPDQRHQCEVIEQAGVGHTAGPIEYPQRQPAFSEVELPTLARAEINERKLRALGPDQSRFGADRSCVSQRVAVAREQELVAVIDSQVGRRVEIRPAAAAGLLRSLVDMHLEIRIRQPNGRREARNSSADDVDRLLHQMNA